MASKGQNSLGRASISSQFRPTSVLAKQFHGNEIIELNVGGCLFATRYQTLATSNSPYFEAMFRIADTGRVVEMPGAISKDKNGRVFIDRDGELFRFVLQFFRDGKHTALPNDPAHLNMIKREAEFFGLQGLRNLVEHSIADRERQPLSYVAQQRQQTAATEEMIHLLQKLSHQLNMNTYTQLNGFRR